MYHDRNLKLRLRCCGNKLQDNGHEVREGLIYKRMQFSHKQLSLSGGSEEYQVFATRFDCLMT